MPFHDPTPEHAKLFHEGLHLFNTGEWFDAHEAWEELWHECHGLQKKFMQGLIQCAVTLEHARRGNARGALNVFHTAMPKFHGLPEVYMGIRVPRLVDELTRFVEPIEALPEAEKRPGLPRGQKLPVDLGAAPKIVLEYDPYGGGQT